jgi:hypothetical protein
LRHNAGVPHAAVHEYPVRKARWEDEYRVLDVRDRNLAYARLGAFVVALGGALLGFRGQLSWWWLTLPAGGFVALLVPHDRIIRARLAAGRLVAFYERGIARLEDRWVGTGDTGERFLNETHPYAADLDLFGRGSLFELLSLARTRAGEESLANWLKHPATTTVIASRHAALDELRHGLELREALSLAGSDIRAGVHPGEVTRWGETVALRSRLHEALAIVLTLALTSLVVGSWLSGSLVPLVIAAVLRAAYQHRAGEHVESALRQADSAARDLSVLRPALTQLEHERFSSPALRDLQAGLRQSHVDASAAIKRLCRYVEMHDWSHNIVFTPIAAMLMWNTHLAFAVERWRRAHGPHVAEWLRIVGEFEALSSLAAYSYEHPEDPLPTIVTPVSPSARHGILCGQSLGHPLLPASQMVSNDVRLDGEARLLVISGSNMSGKSTFLRTVGINAVLALAGAPVRATSLQISPLAIGATLRIQDSLQQGRSRFFAEITRIREIADTASSQPLLFLLDELFHGTNSHDRLIGAIGVLRNLLDRGAIGLITTHDLALTAITRDLGARAVNMHFEDSFDGTEMRFDFRMKPGPVTRSNAIALMRAVGLDVQEDLP